MKIFYYTATGNSLSVAKALGGELISIPQVDRPENLEFHDEAIGIVFPVFHFTAPKRVQDFIRKARFDTDYFFLIATYGNMAAGAAERVQQIAEEAGHHPAYVNQIVMLDNALDFFDMEQQKESLPEKQVELHLAQIVDDIKNRAHRRAMATDDERTATRMNGMNEERVNHSLVEKYSIDNSCVLCGTCARVCPAGNISVSDSVRFADRCECCFACIHNCPRQAIHLMGEKSGARWRNPAVSLEEIISSNAQSSYHQVSKEDSQ